MTGPEHYAEGERLLREAEAHAVRRLDSRANPLVTQLSDLAQAHFEAAQTAALASALHPKSISWQTALGLLEQKETP